MPVFGIPEAELNQFNFSNAYIADNDRAYPDEGLIRIYALFKPGEGTGLLFNEFVAKLDEQGILLDEYDYPGSHVVLVLQFPEKFREDYDLFMQGKYTKLSPDFKKIFPEKRSEGLKEDYTLHFHIFNKTPGMRAYLEQELEVEIDKNDKNFEYWVIPSISHETLNIEKFLKHENKI